MRYVTVVASPDEGAINRLDRRVTELGLEYRAIHRMELLADDTVATFAEGRGDVAGLRRVLSESPEVVEFSVTGDDDGFFAYTRYAADDLTRLLMEDRRESSYLIDMPVEQTDDGGLRGRTSAPRRPSPTCSSSRRRASGSRSSGPARTRPAPATWSPT